MKAGSASVEIALQHSFRTQQGAEITIQLRDLEASVVFATDGQLDRGIDAHLDTLSRSA